MDTKTVLFEVKSVPDTESGQNCYSGGLAVAALRVSDSFRLMKELETKYENHVFTENELLAIGAQWFLTIFPVVNVRIEFVDDANNPIIYERPEELANDIMGNTVQELAECKKDIADEAQKCTDPAEVALAKIAMAALDTDNMKDLLTKPHSLRFTFVE